MAYQQPFVDGILACLSSGVIAIDAQDRIIIWNQAAGDILRLEPSLALGRRYQEVLGAYSQLGLVGELNMTRMRHGSGTARISVEGDVPTRGPVRLNLCIAVLVDSRLSYVGLVLVIEDRTPSRK